MAEADDKTTTDWIWLCDALELVLAALGSLAIRDRFGVRRAPLEVAWEYLKKWMEAEDVPWGCEEWEGNDAAPLERVVLERGGASLVEGLRRPPVYREGDPQFISVATPYPERNEVRGGGAVARGFRVSLRHLQAKIALLPGASGAGKAGGPAGEPVVVEPIRTGAPSARAPEKLPADPAGKGGARRGWQMHRVVSALKDIYPPDGWTEDPTGVVCKRVADKLAPENKRLGLAAPSWDTVNRALGRGDK